MLLGLNHPDLLASGFLPVPTTALFPLIHLLGPFRALPLLQLRTEFGPSPFTVGRLRAFSLAPRLDTGGTMTQPHTGTCLLELLPSVTRTEDESFIHVRGLHPQSRQSGFNRLIHWWRSDAGKEAVGIDLNILIFWPSGPVPRTKRSSTSPAGTPAQPAALRFELVKPWTVVFLRETLIDSRSQMHTRLSHIIFPRFIS